MVDDALRKRAPYHHGNLPRALVAAAHDLIEEQGIAAVTLRSVAQRVGVTHAAPYRHFKDKAALLSAVAERCLEELEACLRAEEDAVGAAAAYVRFATSRAGSYDVLFSSKPTFAVLTIFRQLLPEHAEDMPARIWSLCHGLAVLVNSGQLETPSADDLIRAATRSLVRL
jgi:AcrR family transcriptional regulator